jgi:uncharacterized membrane protein YkvI
VPSATRAHEFRDVTIERASEVFMAIRSVVNVFFVLLLAVMASSCTVVGGIFKAGFWSGIIVVVLIVAALVFLVAKARD